MLKDLPQHSVSDLLGKLSHKGFVQENDAAIETFVLAQQQDKELPLYLRTLVGIGAFFASLCFIGFVVSITTGVDGVAFIISGFIFSGLALGLLKLSGDNNSIKSSFLIQSSFAFMAAGKTLFVVGMLDVYETGWAATIAILIVTAATYHIYRMSADRFLSLFALFSSILINVLWNEGATGSRELLFNGFTLLQLVGVTVLIANVKIKRDFIPILYSLLFSLCTVTLFLASRAKFGFWEHEEFINPTFVTLLFTAGLIASIAWSAGATEKLKSKPLGLACLSAVLLGLISSPGIILSIILMVLGYARHEKIMIAMGTLLVPVFVFLYYYNLDVSLMEKSGILIGSGIVLLVARFYINFKRWNKGGEG